MKKYRFKKRYYQKFKDNLYVIQKRFSFIIFSVWFDFGEEYADRDQAECRANSLNYFHEFKS